MPKTPEELEAEAKAKAEEEAKAEAAKADTTAEAVKEVASSFKEALKEMRAPETTTTPAPAGPSAAELEQEYEDVKSQYDALCAEGKFADARELERRFEAKVGAASRPRDEDAPAYKAMLATARKDAKRDHGDMFDKYGTEIESEVQGMTAGDRINPDMWDEAIRRVKVNHLEEILSNEREAIEKKVSEEAGKFHTPTSGGSRGRSTEEVTDLSDEQMEAARILGFTHEEYKTALEEQDQYEIKRGMSRGMVHLVDPGKPAEGRF